MIDKFTPEVKEQLGYYVYRLIDPRNGQTFYVGKGQGNRVFAHVKCELNQYEGKSYINKDEDETSLKIQQIRDIINEGLEVIHVIHRYGLRDNSEAFEVEAAVIDCYAGLTNIQAGHASERGVNNVQTIQKTLSCEQYEEPEFEYLIIKINEAVLRERNGDIYETARSAWKIDPKRAEKCDYVFAVLDGVVKGVYKPTSWKPDSRGVERRFEFEGKKAPDEIWEKFSNKRIPEKYRKKGNSNPIQYKKK